MARELDFERRKQQRELEDQEVSLSDRRRTIATSGPLKSTSSSGDATIDQLLEFFLRAEPMIEQVNNLYGQYLAGLEMRPPIERRKQLDQLMNSLQLMNKPTQAYQFRYSTLNASYQAFRDKWDRLCRDLESGKIHRQAKHR
jgi:hypothetical protein